MKKLKSTIEKAINGKFPKGCTLSDVYILIDVYNALVRRETPEFIQGSVKAVLDTCGIKTRPEGIGWIAMR